MKFLITDESNITSDDKFEFFIYGGIIVDEKELAPLCKKVLKLKSHYGIKHERPIKWTNNNWNGEGILDATIHAEFKQRILEMVSKSKCKIIVYLAPHDFYHDMSFVDMIIKFRINKSRQLQTTKYGMNVCLHKFNQYLESIRENGMVISDCFEQAFTSHMTGHCFSAYANGIDYSDLRYIIYPVVQISNEYSQIHQINDVVLGAIQYSMKEMAYNFLPIIKDNFWKSDDTDLNTILGKGFNVYPKRTLSPSIKESTDRIKAKFRRLISVV
ncbi:MAG: DUF3800 domain-containing protein [bacterium]